MFNLIQQYMGDVSLWQLAGELILVILGIMVTIAVWRVLQPMLNSRCNSWGWKLRERLSDEIAGMRDRRILRQMNRSWRDWQQSELSPVGHKGWIFTIPNLKCLAATLRTTTGDYIIHITHQESGNIFGELIYHGRPIVHAEAKCYDFADVTPKRHAVTARLIQIANGVAEGNECERFPSNADVWCFIPAVQSGKTDMADGPRFGESMKKVAAAMTALSNAAAQRKHQTSPAVVALALQNGYVIDENQCIVVPYGENTPEAQEYVNRACQDLKSAGVDAYILFSYPDREAVPIDEPTDGLLELPRTNERHAVPITPKPERDGTTIQLDEVTPNAPVDIPSAPVVEPPAVWLITADTAESRRLQLPRGNGFYKVEVTSEWIEAERLHRITTKLFVEHKIIGSDAPLLVPISNEISSCTDANVLSDSLFFASENIAKAADARIANKLDDVLFGLVPPSTQDDE